MKFSKMSIEEFKILNPKATSLDLERLNYSNSEVLLFKPKNQSYPIYKVTVLKKEFNQELFGVEEYHIQKLETTLSRWDKDWITCGMPKEVIKLL